MDIAIDSCSIILLAKASVLEKTLETHILLITTEVYKEIMEGKKKMFKDALLIEKLKKENKINIIKTDAVLKKKMMQDFNMGDGEASVISSAVKKNIIVAIDNKQGRKAAEINNLKLVGSIEIIVSLLKKKKIGYEKALESLKILKEEGWFDNNLIEKAMEDIKNGRS